MYEWKLLETVAAVAAAAVPFVTAALRNRLEMGLVGTFVTVVAMKFGGLWIGLPCSLGFTLAALLRPSKTRAERQ